MVVVVWFFSGVVLWFDGVMFGFLLCGLLFLCVDDVNCLVFVVVGMGLFLYVWFMCIVLFEGYYEMLVDVFEDVGVLFDWCCSVYCVVLLVGLLKCKVWVVLKMGLRVVLKFVVKLVFKKVFMLVVKFVLKLVLV